MAVIQTCDYCSFSTKNGYLFKRHHARCVRDHGGKKKKKAASEPDDNTEANTSVDSDLADTTAETLTDESFTAEAGTSTEETNTKSVPGEKTKAKSKLSWVKVDPDTSKTAQRRTAKVADVTVVTDPSKIVQKRIVTYTCDKCSMETRSSKDFLFHFVNVHNEELQIYQCTESGCSDYHSRYKHKMIRHLKDVHRMIATVEEIKPFFSNIGSSKGSAKALPKKKKESPESLPTATGILKHFKPVTEKNQATEDTESTATTALDIPAAEEKPATGSGKSPKSIAGKTPKPIAIVNKRMRKPIMSKNASGKLMVKFNRKKKAKKGRLPAPKSVVSGSVGLSSPLKRSITENSSPLSKIAEEVKNADGSVEYKCKECQYVNKDIKNVAKHAVSWHVDTKYFSCSKCDYITFDRPDLQDHYKSHRSEDRFKCEECMYSTDFKPNFDRHRQYHAGSYPKQCTYCSYGCTGDRALQRHITNNHEVAGPPKPKKIKLQAPKVKSKHVEEATGVDDLDDDIAELAKQKVNPNLFFDGGSASMVPRMTLPPPSFTTSLLERETSPVRKLPPNISKYVEKFNGKLVCPICKLSYTRSSDLNRHMKTKHDVKLRDYLENITDEGEFLGQLDVSQISGDSTLNSTVDDADVDEDDDILVKLETSTTDDDVVVPVDLLCKYCDYKATWKSDYRRHLMSHSVEKRYKCSECPKKYKYRGDLNVHIRKDHNKEPRDVHIKRVSTVLKKKNSPSIFKCPSCAYTSAWKSEIDRHSRMHNSEKTFQCLHCEYQTYWRGDIRRHVYKRHNEIMTEGVALNDVIIIKKEFAPQVIGGKKKDGANFDVNMSSDSDAISSRETTPVKTFPVPGHEGSPEVTLSDYVTKTTGTHSPTPSPIKEISTGVFKCQYCGFIANAPSKMNSHIATHTNLKRYMCPTCGRRANWKWDIAKHIRKDHNDQVTQVIKLSKKEAEDTIQAYFEAHPTLKRDHHLNLRTDENDSNSGKDQFYKCSLCDFSAEKRISVNRHVRSTHIGSTALVLLVRKPKIVDIPSIPSAKSPESPPSHHEAPVVESVAPTPSHGKSFMCSDCGKRGSSKGDIKKHYHYAHSDREIRIVYLGDGSSTIFAPKGEVAPEKRPPTPETPSSVSSSSGNESLSKSPSGSKDPKVMGYIKPYMCSSCGRRSNWRWDLTKHIRDRHKNEKGVHIIEMDQATARATYDAYMKEQLPGLNKVSLSVPKRRNKVKAQGTSTADLPSPMAVQSSVVPKQTNVYTPVQSNGTEARNQPIFPQTYVVSPNSDVVSITSLRASNLKCYKCSACIYRSNYRSDVQRHLARRHGPGRASVIVLDLNLAAATIGSYKYDKNGQIDNDISQSKRTPNPPTGPLPAAAWAGLEKRLWKCSVCVYSNADKMDVLKHLAKHNMKNYKCTKCDFTSNCKSAVVRHIQNKHPGDSGAQCKLSIKLIKEGPGMDQRGQSIVPGMTTGTDNSAQTPPVAMTGQESMQNPMAVVTAAVFHCKICDFSSSWRSCTSRHIKKIHNTTEYCANIVKKIVRTKLAINPNTVASIDPNMMASNDPNRVTSNDPNMVASIDPNTVTPTMSIPSQVPTPSPVRSPRKSGEYNRPKNFACKICPYRSSKRKMLNFHITCHKPQPGIKQVKCKQCPYYVSSNRLLSQHIQLHQQEYKTVGNGYPCTPEKSNPMEPPSPSKSPMTPKRHKCQKCPYTTNSKNDFLYHKQFHRPKPTADYKCDYCDYWVSQRRLIKQHMKVHEESPDFDLNCLSPSKLDNAENALINDTIEIAAFKQRIIASKITPSISQSPLVSPMKIASSCTVGGRRGFLRKDGSYRKVHQCKHCPYMNLRLRNMKLHEMMHGKRTATHPLMKCIHCDYHVGSKGLLAHHMKVHQKDYGFEFFESGQKLERSDSMASEESEADGSISLEKKVDTLLEITRFKKYGCEKCPYATSKRARFQHHVELHGSKQKCKCDFCDYSVPTMNLLNQHTRLHYEPNQNLLAAQSILNLTYLPEMPADVALASMITNNNSKKPISITHDHIDLYENQAEDLEPKKLYRCDRCPYANIRRENLVAHLRCHMFKNEFECPYCNYSVGKNHVLAQHVKVHFSPLPELSEWVAQNGNTERLKETKNKDMEEVVEVVKRFQTEKKAKEMADSMETKDTAEDIKGEKADKVNGNGDTDVEKKEKDGEDEMETSDKKEDIEKDKVGDEKANKTEDKASEAECKESDVVMNKPQPSTSKADEEPMEEKPSINQGETGESVDLYICQYCDREFPASGSLIRHEVQHLIGSSYTELVSQLLEAAEKTAAADNQSISEDVNGKQSDIEPMEEEETGVDKEGDDKGGNETGIKAGTAEEDVVNGETEDMAVDEK